MNWFLLWICMCFGHTPLPLDGFPNSVIEMKNGDGTLQIFRCMRCHLVYWEVIKPIKLFERKR